MCKKLTDTFCILFALIKKRVNLSLRDSKNWFKAPSIFFFCITDCSKAILLLWFSFLCFGVEFSCCLNLMYVFRVLVKFGLLFRTYWEIPAHSA